MSKETRVEVTLLSDAVAKLVRQLLQPETDMDEGHTAETAAKEIERLQVIQRRLDGKRTKLLGELNKLVTEYIASLPVNHPKRGYLSVSIGDNSITWINGSGPYLSHHMTIEPGRRE